MDAGQGGTPRMDAGQGGSVAVSGTAQWAISRASIDAELSPGGGRPMRGGGAAMPRSVSFSRGPEPPNGVEARPKFRRRSQLSTNSQENSRMISELEALSMAPRIDSCTLDYTPLHRRNSVVPVARGVLQRRSSLTLPPNVRAAAHVGPRSSDAAPEGSSLSPSAPRPLLSRRKSVSSLPALSSPTLSRTGSIATSPSNSSCTSFDACTSPTPHTPWSGPRDGQDHSPLPGSPTSQHSPAAAGADHYSPRSDALSRGHQPYAAESREGNGPRDDLRSLLMRPEDYGGGGDVVVGGVGLAAVARSVAEGKGGGGSVGRDGSRKKVDRGVAGMGAPLVPEAPPTAVTHATMVPPAAAAPPPAAALGKLASAWSDIRAVAARNFQKATSLFEMLPKGSSSPTTAPSPSAPAAAPAASHLSPSQQQSTSPTAAQASLLPSHAPSASILPSHPPSTLLLPSHPPSASLLPSHPHSASSSGRKLTSSHLTRRPLLNAPKRRSTFSMPKPAAVAAAAASSDGSTGSSNAAHALSRGGSCAAAALQQMDGSTGPAGLQTWRPMSEDYSRALLDSLPQLLASSIARRSEWGSQRSHTAVDLSLMPHSWDGPLHTVADSTTTEGACAAAATAAAPTSNELMISAKAKVVVDLRANGTPVMIKANTGVTVEYLAMFARHLASLEGASGDLPDESLTTCEVLKTFVKRQTITRNCSFLDLVPPQHHAAPLLFVSHAHAASFAGLVASVVRFCSNNNLPTSTGIFLDVLCMNPFSAGITPECMTTHWALIDRCKHVLLVVDHKGASLSRLWCCYEAWIAALADKSSVVAAVVGGGTAAGSATAAVKPRSDKLQVIFDNFDIESCMEVYACLDLSLLQVQQGADRQAIISHTATQALGVDLDGLQVMLPSIHEALLQCTRTAYFAAAKTKYIRPTCYIDASLHYTNMLVLKGQAWEAEKTMRQDQMWALKNNASGYPGFSLLANNLAFLMKRNNLLDVAETLCLEGLRREVDDDVLRLPAVRAAEGPVERLLLVNLQDVLFRSGDARRCEALCRRLVEAGLEGKVETKPLVFGMLQPMRHLGKILIHQECMADVRAMLVDTPMALSLNDVSSGPAEVTAFQHWLASYYQLFHDLPKAVEVLHQCAKTRRTIYGSTHALTLETLVALAGITVLNSQPEEAERVLDELYSTIQRALGLDHPVAAKARLHLAALRDKLAGLGRQSLDFKSDTEAEALFRRALKVNKSVRSESAEQALLGSLLEVLNRLGKTEEALFLKRRYHVA